MLRLTFWILAFLLGLWLTSPVSAAEGSTHEFPVEFTDTFQGLTYHWCITSAVTGHTGLCIQGATE